MKVIKAPGVWQARQVTCTCGAVLEIEFGDLRREHYDGDWREPAYDKVYAKCPVSGHRIDVNDVPTWMVDRIPTK